MFAFGSQGLYEWLVTDQEFDLFRICPEVVLGKYIAITSIDSRPLVPTDEEKSGGWESRGEIEYSPKVENVRSLPRADYDEWYIFASPADLGTNHLGDNVFEVTPQRGHVNVFVNHGGFALDRPEMKDLTNLFWQQIEWIQPESYMADGNYLNFVSANKTLFAIVRDALKTLS
jgi:hypothetical protein